MKTYRVTFDLVLEDSEMLNHPSKWVSDAVLPSLFPSECIENIEIVEIKDDGISNEEEYLEIAAELNKD